MFETVFWITAGVLLLAFVVWALVVAIRRDQHGRSVEPRGPFDSERSRAESDSRVYFGQRPK